MHNRKPTVSENCCLRIEDITCNMEYQDKEHFKKIILQIDAVSKLI